MRGLPSLLYAEQMADARRRRADAVAVLVRRLLFWRPAAARTCPAANANRRPGGGRGVTA
ncbi:hypothetical protein M2352_002295 [Azospirillum fermentarium]|uniref:hypothetical protein n=1 Tax=Azospirillum fermentarium TaxID=1233114 RepID=UPI00222618A6|nr:hypothetical protein [Azospirillum fermentarium]MCW2246704.1 hypothetical protein [Azospirillum fermentarium]